jgi:hypothetical protein
LLSTGSWLHISDEVGAMLLRMARVWLVFVMSPTYLLGVLHLASAPIESQKRFGLFHRRRREQIDRQNRRFSSLFQIRFGWMGTADR